MTRDGRRRAVFIVLAGLALPPVVEGQVRRLGIEFQVNTNTIAAQSFPSVAASASGDFVVAWQSNAQDGASLGVFANRFSSAGAVLATEFQVNIVTYSAQWLPRVAAEANGDFVIVWQSYGSQDGSSEGVFARRFSSAGAAFASEFQVNSFTIFQQLNPAVATDADGDFVVAWQSVLQDGDLYGVFARRFSSAGAALASEFQVNTYTTGYQHHPSVAADAAGDFVVVWQSNGQDGSLEGIFARRFSSAGAALASEFQVNSYTTSLQNRPSVSASASGDFVVAWQSYLQEGSDYGIFARRFSSAGAPLAGEFQVNTRTVFSQRYASVAAHDNGDFVVTWKSDQDGSTYGIFARRFSSAGAALTSEFQVNTYTTDKQLYPSVAAADGGHFIVAWQSFGQDHWDTGIFAQRLKALPLDVDGNGSVQALTDGLLVLRFLFGFTGPTLTSGAVGGGCTRCDAAAIETYLTGLGLVLDIDGNTTKGALTDGLLALRYLFGFTGSTLTTGVVGGGCARCDAAAIEGYLASLTE